MTEKWLPVVGYEGRYEVSDLGNVRSVSRLRSNGTKWRGRNLKILTKTTGYKTVNLYLDNAMRAHVVHRLVLRAFAGPEPGGCVALHRDGDRTNNALTNLAWGTPSENAMDQVRHGTHNNASKTHCPAGHPYSGDNLHIRPANGSRRCRACDRIAKTRKAA